MRFQAQKRAGHGWHYLQVLGAGSWPPQVGHGSQPVSLVPDGFGHSFLVPLH